MDRYQLREPNTPESELLEFVVDGINNNDQRYCGILDSQQRIAIKQLYIKYRAYEELGDRYLELYAKRSNLLNGDIRSISAVELNSTLDQVQDEMEKIDVQRNEIKGKILTITKSAKLDLVRNKLRGAIEMDSLKKNLTQLAKEKAARE